MADIEKMLKDGNRLLAQEEFKKAFSKFKKAADEDPTSSEAFFGKAEAGMFVDKVSTDDIVESYNKAIELDPENPFYLRSLGAFCLEVGKFNEAEQAYTKAAELDPESASDFYSEFGVEYFKIAPIFYEQFLDEKTQEMITKKALHYLLKAIDLDEESAKKLL